MNTLTLKQAQYPLGSSAPPPSSVATQMAVAMDLQITFPSGTLNQALQYWGYVGIDGEAAVREFLQSATYLLPWATIRNDVLGALGEFFGACGWLAQSNSTFDLYKVIRISPTSPGAPQYRPDFWIDDSNHGYTVLECKATTESRSAGLSSPVCSQIQRTAHRAYRQLPFSKTGQLVAQTYPLHPKGTGDFLPPRDSVAVSSTFLKYAALQQGALGACPNPANRGRSCFTSCLQNHAVQLLLHSNGQSQTLSSRTGGSFHATHQATRAVSMGLDHAAGAYFSAAVEQAREYEGVEQSQYALLLANLLSRRSRLGGRVELALKHSLRELVDSEEHLQVLLTQEPLWTTDDRSYDLLPISWQHFWNPNRVPPWINYFLLQDMPNEPTWFARQRWEYPYRVVTLMPPSVVPRQRDEQYARWRALLRERLSLLTGVSDDHISDGYSTESLILKAKGNSHPTEIRVSEAWTLPESSYRGFRTPWPVVSFRIAPDASAEVRQLMGHHVLPLLLHF